MKSFYLIGLVFFIAPAAFAADGDGKVMKWDLFLIVIILRPTSEWKLYIFPYDDVMAWWTID